MDNIFYWAIAGVALMLLEIMSATFYLIFLGIACLFVATVLYFSPGIEIWEQFLLFSIFSLSLTLSFRKKLLQSWRTKVDFKTDQVLLLTEDVPPHEQVFISYQGTLWSAYNTSAELLKKGSHCKISKIDGVTLHLTK